MKQRLGRVLIGGAALVALLGACAQSASPTLTVAAPSRVAQPMRFVTQGLPLGIEVTPENEMLDLLREGTDVDIVVLGDPEVYSRAISERLISDGTELVRDEVVLVLPDGSAADSLSEVQSTGLRIGYCSEASSCHSVWSRVRSQFHESAEAEELNVHDLLDKLGDGSLDAAIMFFSDATESSKGLRVLHFDDSLDDVTHVSIHAAVVTGTNLPRDAADLMEQITGTDYIAAFVGAGFLSA